MFVAGEPGRGEPSAEAEGGVVRSDPRPQPAAPPRHGFAAGPEEAAPPPGEPGRRADGGNGQTGRSDPAAAAGLRGCGAPVLQVVSPPLITPPPPTGPHAL